MPRVTVALLPDSRPGREGISHAQAFASARILAVEAGIVRLESGRVVWRAPEPEPPSYWTSTP